MFFNTSAENKRYGTFGPNRTYNPSNCTEKPSNSSQKTIELVPRDHQIVPSSIKLYLKTIKVNSNCTNKNIKLRTLYPIILTHLKIGVLFLSSKKGWVITKAVLFSRLKKKKWFSRLRCSLFVAKPICVAKKNFSGLKFFFFFEAKNRSCINMSIHLAILKKTCYDLEISNDPDEKDSLGRYCDESKHRPTSAVHFHETWSVLT